jgi:hypothetical protein
MNKTMRIRLYWGVIPLLLSVLACNLGTPMAREALPSTATPAAAIPPSAAPPPSYTATVPFQGAMPVQLPGQRADHAGDIDSSANAHRQMVSGGDVFVHGLYERPFNAVTMDTYFPYLDIVDTQGFKDGTWGYATITLQNTDPNGDLPAQYGIELDLDRDGRGDWLILTSSPASTQWTTQGVRAWRNSNGDIGGVAVMAADTHPRGGDGYEVQAFDQGQGSLIDGAWTRISDSDPKTVELAFKLEMLGSSGSYAMGAWAGSTVDPGMFDYHDHMTHLQAGSPNPGYEVYPLKDMAEIDNTCRLAVGFAPTGKEPGLCQTVQKQEGEGNVPCYCPQSPAGANIPCDCP